MTRGTDRLPDATSWLHAGVAKAPVGAALGQPCGASPAQPPPDTSPAVPPRPSPRGAQSA
jgi:hypothetical protein